MRAVSGSAYVLAGCMVTEFGDGCRNRNSRESASLSPLEACDGPGPNCAYKAPAETRWVIASSNVSNGTILSLRSKWFNELFQLHVLSAVIETHLHAKRNESIEKYKYIKPGSNCSPFSCLVVSPMYMRLFLIFAFKTGLTPSLARSTVSCAICIPYFLISRTCLGHSCNPISVSLLN